MQIFHDCKGIFAFMKMHIRCFVDCLELTFALRFEQYLLTDRDLYVSAKGFVTQSVTLHSRHADPTMIEQKLLFENRAEELNRNVNSKSNFPLLDFGTYI